MPTLVIRLAGPLQSWGVAGRFDERTTLPYPSKTGVIGLLAAALGRSRGEDLSDLDALTMSVRIDKPGVVVRDYHTAGGGHADRVVTANGARSEFGVVSNRYYLADAVFVVALSGEQELITEIAHALTAPRWPLALGRRACPPELPLLIGTYDAPVDEVLVTTVPVTGDHVRVKVVHDFGDDATHPDASRGGRQFTNRQVGHRWIEPTAQRVQTTAHLLEVLS
jgi:CRISPR system Cascade subunit CasD